VKSWLILLGGFIVWTVHFFGLYLIAEFAPSATLVIALTILCIIADLWLLRWLRAMACSEAFAQWRRSVGMAGAVLSLLAVLWQGLPVMLA
jgi:hypothetical protein